MGGKWPNLKEKIFFRVDTLTRKRAFAMIPYKVLPIDLMTGPSTHATHSQREHAVAESVFL